MKIAIIMGVSGSGKTSIGKALSELTDRSFVDADDCHPPANIAKMSRGEPLTDRDRQPWLAALTRMIAERIARDEPTILACSALKRAYRQQLASPDPHAVGFIYLQVPIALLQQRLSHRAHHFMKLAMLQSQLATLEEPSADEATIVRVRDDMSAEAIASEIRDRLSPEFRIDAN